MKAQEQIAKLVHSQRLISDDVESQYSVSYKVGNNNDIINILSDSGSYETVIGGQDTYIFNDGSYITRSVDTYWIGNNSDDFEISVNSLVAFRSDNTEGYSIDQLKKLDQEWAQIVTKNNLTEHTSDYDDQLNNFSDSVSKR